MHKSAAKYEQSRTVRAATEQPRNEHIDGSVFKATADFEWARLSSEKKEIEAELSDLNMRISRAKAIEWEGRGYTHRNAWKHWAERRTTLVARLAPINASMERIKVEKKAARLREVKTFEQAFVDIAKDMLAEPVFYKLRVAALHRMTEMDD